MPGILTACAMALFFIFSAPASAAEDAPLSVRASVSGGHDNNTGLDSFRKGDFFAQETAVVRYRRRMSDNIRLKVFYDIFNVNYFEATDQSFLLQSLGTGADWILSKDTALQLDYNFDYLYYTNNEPVNSYLHETRLGFLRKLSKSFHVKAGVSPSFRQYTDNKIRRGSGFLSRYEDRSDRRVIFDGEFGFQLSQTLLARLGGAWYRNDSDDSFHDFYDYDSATVFTAATLKLTPKLFAFLKLAYENHTFHSRPITDDAETFEDADFYTATASAYYTLRKNLSLALSYSYRQKESNEPSHEYSGSISTVGLYYSF